VTDAGKDTKQTQARQIRTHSSLEKPKRLSTGKGGEFLKQIDGAMQGRPKTPSKESQGKEGTGWTQPGGVPRSLGPKHVLHCSHGNCSTERKERGGKS